MLVLIRFPNGHETMDDALMLSSRRCIRAIDDDDPDLMAGSVESIVAKVE